MSNWKTLKKTFSTQYNGKSYLVETKNYKVVTYHGFHFFKCLLPKDSLIFLVDQYNTTEKSDFNGGFFYFIEIILHGFCWIYGKT